MSEEESEPKKMERERQPTIALLPRLSAFFVSLSSFFFFDSAHDTIPEPAASYTASGASREVVGERRGDRARGGERETERKREATTERE